MKKLVARATRVALILAMMTAATFANAQPADAAQGTIVSVKKSAVASPEITGADDTDNPLQAQYYRYDISVKVGGRIYVGRYESQFDFLADSWTPDHGVVVRLEKGGMYLDSYGNSLKTTIVSKR